MNTRIIPVLTRALPTTFKSSPPPLRGIHSLIQKIQNAFGHLNTEGTTSLLTRERLRGNETFVLRENPSRVLKRVTTPSLEIPLPSPVQIKHLEFREEMKPSPRIDRTHHLILGKGNIGKILQDTFGETALVISKKESTKDTEECADLTKSDLSDSDKNELAKKVAETLRKKGITHLNVINTYGLLKHDATLEASDDSELKKHFLAINKIQNENAIDLVKRVQRLLRYPLYVTWVTLGTNYEARDPLNPCKEFSKMKELAYEAVAAERFSSLKINTGLTMLSEEKGESSEALQTDVDVAKSITVGLGLMWDLDAAKLELNTFKIVPGPFLRETVAKEIERQNRMRQSEEEAQKRYLKLLENLPKRPKTSEKDLLS